MTRENALQTLADAKTDGKPRFTQAQLDEYVGEAEHQDGLGYWKQFRDPDSLVEDVRLYFECKGATTVGPEGSDGEA